MIFSKKRSILILVIPKIRTVVIFKVGISVLGESTGDGAVSVKFEFRTQFVFRKMLYGPYSACQKW